MQYRAYGVVSLFEAIFCRDNAIEAEIAYSVDASLAKELGFVHLVVYANPLSIEKVHRLYRLLDVPCISPPKSVHFVYSLSLVLLFRTSTAFVHSSLTFLQTASVSFGI